MPKYIFEHLEYDHRKGISEVIRTLLIKTNNPGHCPGSSKVKVIACIQDGFMPSVSYQNLFHLVY